MLEEAEDRAARAAVEGRPSAPVTRVTIRAGELYIGDIPASHLWPVAKQSGREMTGFLSTLSPAQQEAAKAYRGDDAVISILPKPYNHSRKPLVIIESPYSGDVARNTEYARACLLDSLRRGEAPIASHLLHTQVLDDLRPDERELGIEAGLEWYRVAEKCVVYENFGISRGMAEGTARARSYGVPVEYRRLEAWRDAA
ncbi:hypothetical protein [Brucella anthropi]|uniref:DUF7768 domain-containing protein n=1 Tax=Brucella anthropi TaxID=529 RepID=UPI00296FFEE4|nr:hypothetical protein [Ochrobactrum sp. MYb49]